MLQRVSRQDLTTPPRSPSARRLGRWSKKALYVSELHQASSGAVIPPFICRARELSRGACRPPAAGAAIRHSRPKARKCWVRGRGSPRVRAGGSPCTPQRRGAPGGAARQASVTGSTARSRPCTCERRGPACGCGPCISAAESRRCTSAGEAGRRGQRPLESCRDSHGAWEVHRFTCAKGRARAGGQPWACCQSISVQRRVSERKSRCRKLCTRARRPCGAGGRRLWGRLWRAVSNGGSPCMCRQPQRWRTGTRPGLQQPSNPGGGGAGRDACCGWHALREAGAGPRDAGGCCAEGFRPPLDPQGSRSGPPDRRAPGALMRAPHIRPAHKVPGMHQPVRPEGPWLCQSCGRRAPASQGRAAAPGAPG